MRFQLNLTQKFIGFLLLTSILPLLWVGISSYQVARRILQAEAINYTGELIENQKDYLELQLQQIESLIANISNVDEIIKVLDSKTTTDTYTNLATKARIGYILNGYTNLKGLVSIDIFTMHGAHYHVGDTLNISELRSAVKSRILAQTMQPQQRQIVWIGIEDNVNANSSAQKVITAAKLLTTTNPETLESEPIAILLVNYSIDYLYNHFKQSNLGEGSYLLVLDAQNRLIYHPDRRLAGTPINPSLVNLLSANRGTFVESIDGQNTLVSYVRSDLSNWIVLSLVPLDTLVAPAVAIGGATSLALLLSLPVILIAAWSVSTKIVKPIRQITQRFEQFQAGSLDWQTPLVVSRGQDEISELGKWFNAFLDSLAARQRAEEALTEGADRERGILRVVERMRQTLDLTQIFNTTTAELQQLLKCDQTVIFRLNSAGEGTLVAESNAQEQKQLHKTSNVSNIVTDLCPENHPIIETWYQLDQTFNPAHLQPDPKTGQAHNQRYICVHDVYDSGCLPPCIQTLAALQVRAYLIVPIFQGDQLWGLLAGYQNTKPRTWDDAEINLVIHISSQLGIALQQAELLAQTQKQSADLEKAKDAAEAASRAKSEFLANISHELRTPLNAILGFSEVMGSDQDLSPEYQDYLAIINHSGQHLLALINDVLEMSKIEAGQITLNVDSFSLNYLLDSLEEMLHLKAVGKELTLIFERACDLPEYIAADESRLRQILLNLLGNAIKFTQTGHVILRVQAEQNSGQAGDRSAIDNPSVTLSPSLHLLFEVEDTGPGIAPEEMQHLFQPFVQTRTGQQLNEGTGLGLAISHKFVKLMGGEMSVDTIVGQGSVFKFDIWADPADRSRASIPTITQQVATLAPNQPLYRILVIEDHWENRQLLTKLLVPLGFEVRTAQQGQEGVDIWEDWQPQLILMDLRMPLLDGYEATKLIRTKEKKLAMMSPASSFTKSAYRAQTQTPARTVIIALTASAFEETRIEVLAAGCDDFLRKPIQRELLLAKLAEHLGIEYIYQPDPLPSPNPDPLTTALLMSHLIEMPIEWVGQLHEAATTGFDKRISQLIEQIPKHHHPLAQALANWNYDFRVDKIIDLTEQLVK